MVYPFQLMTMVISKSKSHYKNNSNSFLAENPFNANLTSRKNECY
jgi:hypothetical protein